MALPEISEEATSAQVAEALKQVALEGVEIRNKASRGEELTDDDKTALRKRLDFIRDMDPIQSALEASERSESAARRTVQSKGPSAAMAEVRPEARGFMSQVLESDEYQFIGKRDSGFANGQSREVKLNGSLVRTLITSSTTDTSSGGVFLPLAQPVPPVPRQRRLFVRDLLSQMTTTYSAVPYIVETNVTTTEITASSVAEGIAKPEVEADFGGQIASMKKIAAWVPVTSEIIEDAPLLQGYIENRLTYMLALREELEVLYGNGLGADLKGLLTWSNRQTQAQAGGGSDLALETGTAIGKVENVDLQADGAVYNPTDFWAAVTARHSTQFDNGFGGNAPAVLSQISWGLPAVRSRSMTAGKFLVGAFQLGATLVDREETVIRLGNQHSTYFTENKVAILAEERVGLMVHRPDAFVDATV